MAEEKARMFLIGTGKSARPVKLPCSSEYLLGGTIGPFAVHTGHAHALRYSPRIRLMAFACRILHVSPDDIFDYEVRDSGNQTKIK